MSANTTKRHRRPLTFGRVSTYLLLIIAAALFLVPVYMLLITGFKSYQEVSLAKMWVPPDHFSLESFSKAWFGSKDEGFRGLSGNFFNSFWLTIPASLLSAFIGSLNGYVFSKWKFKGSNVLFAMMLFGMFIPYQSILIPLVRVLQWITHFTGPLQKSDCCLGCREHPGLVPALAFSVCPCLWNHWRAYSGACDLRFADRHAGVQKLLFQHPNRSGGSRND